MAKSAGQIQCILVILGLILVIRVQSVTSLVPPPSQIPSIPGSLSKKYNNACSDDHASPRQPGHNKRQPQLETLPSSSPIPASSTISPPYHVPLLYSDNAIPSVPRPPKKPGLLTDYEYQNHWDPQNNTLRLGVLLSLSAGRSDHESITIRKAISVIRMAVNDVNRQKIIPGINMSIILRDSQDPYFSTGARGVAAITAAGSLISAKVGGVIGDLASDLTKHEALMTSSVEIPQCSFASTNTMLSNTDLFRYFYRTIPTTTVLLNAVFEVIKHIGWHRVLFIYDSEVLGRAEREYFGQKARNLGITVLGYQPLNTDGVPEDPTYKALKDSIKDNLSFIHVLIATRPTQYNVLREMKIAGFVGPKYGWVTVNDISDQIRAEPDPSEYDGVIMIENGWQLKGYEPYEDFLAGWMQLDPSDYPGAADPILGHSEAEVYSCVMMMANVYGDYVRRMGNAVDDLTPNSPFIREVISGNHTKNIDIPGYYQIRPYKGPSGPVTLDLNGDRKEGYYSALSLQNGTSIIFASIIDTNYTIIKEAPSRGAQRSFPHDASHWGLQNPGWNNSGGIIYGILCILGIATTLICVALVYYFRNNIVIKASSPTFCVCELSGILLVFIWCLLHVGVPTKASCVARDLLLPCGITLLSGSLVVKNYRIYRIFNSVTVQSHVFKTRMLLTVVAVAVILSIIPMIVEVIVDTPLPTNVNTRKYQWVICKCARAPLIWYILSAVVPVLMVVFGAFLAVMTRNVAYLWNEARQIALVLYNVLIFTVIIIVAQAFPTDLYMVAFYMTIICTYATFLLALLVLFVPKFWRIFQANQQGNQRLTGSLWSGGRASERGRENHCGGAFATGTILMGRGGGPESERPLGDLRNDSFSQIEVPAVETVFRDRFGSDATALTLIGVYCHDKENSQDKDSNTIQSVISLNSELAGGAEVGEGDETTQERIVRPALCVTPFSEAGASTGNPIDLWMYAQLAKNKQDASRGELLNGTFMDKKGLRGEKADQEVSEEGEKAQRRTPSRSGHGSCSDNVAVIADGELSAGSSNTRKARHVGFAPPSESESSRARLQPWTKAANPHDGAEIRLDSYVFLLPIFVERNTIASFLSHWSMATLILIPEAHAFMSVDSAEGRSTSYLMLTMTQVVTERQTTVRVTTNNSGTILIRFPCQISLDSWMNLFSEEDLIALSPSRPVPVTSTFPSREPTTRIYSTGRSPGLESAKSMANLLAEDGGPVAARKRVLQQESLSKSSAVPGSDNSTSAIFTIPNPISQSDAPPLQTLVPIPQHPHPATTNTTAPKNSSFSGMETPEDEEDEDLYDPEFGIGGNGRRRSSTPWNVCSGISTRSTHGVIPSAQVISAAAAAVSSGWSSSEALAAATVDPSGSFLSGSTTSVRNITCNSATSSARGSRSPQSSLSSSMFLSRGHS